MLRIRVRENGWDVASLRARLCVRVGLALHRLNHIACLSKSKLAHLDPNFFPSSGELLFPFRAGGRLGWRTGHATWRHAD